MNTKLVMIIKKSRKINWLSVIGNWSLNGDATLYKGLKYFPTIFVFQAPNELLKTWHHLNYTFALSQATNWTQNKWFWKYLKKCCQISSLMWVYIWLTATCISIITWLRIEHLGKLFQPHVFSFYDENRNDLVFLELVALSCLCFCFAVFGSMVARALNIWRKDNNLFNSNWIGKKLIKAYLVQGTVSHDLRHMFVGKW